MLIDHGDQGLLSLGALIQVNACHASANSRSELKLLFGTLGRTPGWDCRGFRDLDTGGRSAVPRGSDSLTALREESGLMVTDADATEGFCCMPMSVGTASLDVCPLLLDTDMDVLPCELGVPVMN